MICAKKKESRYFSKGRTEVSVLSMLPSLFPWQPGPASSLSRPQSSTRQTSHLPSEESQFGGGIPACFAFYFQLPISLPSPPNSVNAKRYFYCLHQKSFTKQYYTVKSKFDAEYDCGLCNMRAIYRGLSTRRILNLCLSLARGD